MQSTGGSLTSRIESRRYKLVKEVKAISIEHCRSGHVRDRGATPGSLTATKQKAGYRKTPAVPIVTNSFFYSRISRLAPPHPGHALVAISNQQVCSN
jgi:hypothetical protein